MRGRDGTSGSGWALGTGALLALLAAGCGSGRELAPAPGPTTSASAAALPNLTVAADRFDPSTDWATFAATSCEVQEACIGAPGLRRLLRFTALFWNVGGADLHLGGPAGNPLFELSPCHGHYHLQGFARYELLDGRGQVVVTGRKQGFCLGDDEALPGTTTLPRYGCADQGISAGWGDVYGASLACQWLDVTDVPPGTYRLRVTVNAGRIIQESRYDDDVGEADVVIGP